MIKIKTKLIAIISIIVLFLNFLPLTSVSAATLSHSDMSEIYGSSYKNALLETVVEVNAKASTRLEENRNLLTQYYDGTKDYINQRIKDYGNVRNFSDLLIEQASGVMTLSEGVLDLLSSLFKSDSGDEYTPPQTCRVVPDTAYNNPNGWNVRINDDCSLAIWMINWRGNKERLGKQLQAGKQREDRTNYNVGGYTTNLPPVPNSIAAMNGILNSISPDIYIGDANGNRVYNLTPVVDTNKLHFNSAFNNYRNNPTSRQPVYIPQLQPKLSCPDGDKVVRIDGRGGFVHANGVPVNTDGCTVYWQKPNVTVDDDGKVLLTDPDTGEVIDAALKPPKDKIPVEDKGEGCEGVLCFLGALTSGIADLISAILGLVGDILDGLFDLIKRIIVPPDNYFSKEMDAIKEQFFNEEIEEGIQSIEELSSAGGGTFESVNVSIMGVDNVMVVDSSSVNKSLDTIHSWIRGVFYPLLLFFNINMLYRLIRGTSLVGIGKIDFSPPKGDKK